MAIEFPVAERLGIKWGAATPDDIGRYMGLLAAINQVATTIALKNERKTASDDDYKAAFAAFCLWPPNKPPLAQPYWNQAFAAFSKQDIRDALQAGVGPLAITLPASIEAGKGSDVVLSEWPKIEAAYFTEVLNLGYLKDNK
jgi:hypothetical protein